MLVLGHSLHLILSLLAWTNFLSQYARRSQRTTQISIWTGAIQGQASSTQTRMPAIYIAKYNRFVDNILGRINRILGKSYDPVRVKLQAPADKSNKKTGSKVTANKNKNKATKNKKKKNSNRSRAPQLTNKMGEFEVARSTESESREPAFVLISKTSDIKTQHPIRNVTLEVRASPVSKKRKPSKNSTKNTNSNKNTSSSSTSNKNTASTKARATLYGLSTLRRDGDVVVNALKDYTSVKTNFLLGPLTLRVEKEVIYVYLYQGNVLS